jgi:hypothetical protein
MTRTAEIVLVVFVAVCSVARLVYQGRRIGLKRRR